MTALLVAQPEPGTDQKVVDGSVGTGVAGGPAQDGAGDQVRMAGDQFVIGQSQLGRRGRPETVDERIGTVQEVMELFASALVVEVEDHAALRSVPG